MKSFVLLDAEFRAQPGGAVLPELTQYTIRVTSDRNLVAQVGRLDTTQART